MDAASWRERRADARAVTGAWFSEYFARVRELPKLPEFLEEMFGEAPQLTPQEQDEKDAAAARAWNRQFASLWKAQEMAKAQQAAQAAGA